MASLKNFNVSISATPQVLGSVAAEKSAEIITQAIRTRGRARMLVATGNSQVELIRNLVAKDLPWGKVDAFHLDEYVGISDRHPASFRRWIKIRFEDRVRPGTMEYLIGDASDANAEAARYAKLLEAGSVDLAFVGFGENGHIAFNDPHVADFNDPLTVKRVELDAACRAQQVNEGHFPDSASVPTHALSVTCSGLFRAEHWICCVPEQRKAAAVQKALEGPLTPACPASLVRNHPRAFIYLDEQSSSQLSQR
jgi:glucosamine-6-phosphate deaminase